MLKQNEKVKKKKEKKDSKCYNGMVIDLRFISKFFGYCVM